MDNSQVNAKELFEVSGEVLEIITAINLEISELEEKGNNVIGVCQDFRSFDGKRIMNVGDLTDFSGIPDNSDKICYTYGEKEVEEKVTILLEKLIGISNELDVIYRKVKLSREVSEDIKGYVKNIGDVMAEGTNVVVAKEYVDYQKLDNNLDFQGQPIVSKAQFLDSVQTNFEQNRNLTNQINEVVYKGVYDKIQKMLDNSEVNRL